LEFQLLKFLHVLTIIGAIVLAEGTILHIWVAARRHDVLALRHAIEESERGDRLSNPLVVLSIIFGVAAALAGQIDLTAPWLITAYGVLILGFVGLGLGGGLRHIERLKGAVAASPVDKPSAELVALVNHPWSYVVTFGPPTLMAALVYLMVVKPNLW